jgi:hypothetical protein
LKILKVNYNSVNACLRKQQTKVFARLRIQQATKTETIIFIIKEQNNVLIARGKLLNTEIKIMKGCVL